MASRVLSLVAVLSLVTILPAGGDEPAKPASPEAAKAADPAKTPEVPAAPEKPPVDTAKIAAEADRLLADECPPAAGKTPAAQSTDEVFLRRVYLDLIGRNPLPEQVTKFVLDPAADKRTKLVEKLLADERFGSNWSRYWRDVIMYRRTEDRALIVAQPLTDFLKEELNKNTSWAKIATELITATGDVRENGKTGLIMAQAGQPEETVAEVSRIFLGIQIQCAQCHNHPTDSWKREQFHELAAFFPRVAVRPMMGDVRTFLVEANDARFGGGGFMGNRFRGSPEHLMPDLQNPTARGKQMSPVFFVTGQKLPFGTKDADRRSKLAEWITSEKDPWFAKAVVNRLWSELCGEGFHEPVDDMGPEREFTAPKTLDYLAHEFAATGYDMKQLFRTIMTTTAYQRESRARRNSEQPAFQANVPQRLRADVIYDNLSLALDLNDGGGRLGMFGGGGARGPIRGPRQQFAATFGFDPSAPRDEVAGTIPQALVLMNSQQFNGAITGFRSTIDRLASNTKDNDALTTELYLRFLAREPSESELTTVRNYIAKVGFRGDAFEDLAWSLMNSTEFLHRN